MVEIYLLISLVAGAIIANLAYGPLKRFEKRRNEKYRREKSELVDS